MNYSIVICGSAYILSALLIALSPVKEKKAKESAGKAILELNRSSSKSFIAVYIISIVIITLILLKSFGLAIDAILCGCAVLAINLISRDRISRKMAGVYENALIFDGKTIFLSDILSLPTLAYEEDKDISSLKMVTKQEGELFLTFTSSEERNNVVETLLSLNPALKPE